MSELAEERLIDSDLERFVLGTLQLQGAEVFSRVANVIAEVDFAIDRHRIIWRAMSEIVSDGEELDRVTLAHLLFRQRELERIGGISYLADLDVGLPVTAHPESYARQLRKKTQERKAFHVLDTCAMEAALGIENTATIISGAMEQLEAVTALAIARSADNLGDAIAAHPGGIGEFLRPPRGSITIPFPLAQRRTAGMKPGEFWILGARPSMGKTALGLHLALDAAECGHPVLFISLEMSQESIGKRLLSRLASVNLLDLIHGELTDVERVGIDNAIRQLRRIPLYVIDRHCKTVQQIRAQIEGGCKQGKYGLLIVDYLGLMDPGRHENRNIEISVMSRSLKLLATECRIPVLALHQLSRALETRTDKRPELSDLRDSGSLEQDADVVFFLYREGYYKRDDPSVANSCELLIRKCRNGQVGKVDAEFYAPYGLFSGGDGD